VSGRLRLRGALLSVGAVLGVACLASAGAMALLGIRPLVVRSGSMSPAIPTGSLALGVEAPARSVHPGDVVSVLAPSGTRVMHRVVRAEPIDEHVLLTLQGDANGAADPHPYAVDDVLRIRLHVPRLGYALSALSEPVGRFALGALGGALLVTALWPPARDAGGRRRPRHRPQHLAPRRRPARRRAVATVAAVLLVAGAAVEVAGAPAALAAFGDTATATTGSFAAYAVPAPTGVTCHVSGNVLTGFTAHIEWPAVTSPHALGYSATIVDSGAALSVASSGGNRYVEITKGLLGSLLGTTITIRLRALVPTTPSWLSAGTDQPLEVALLGLGFTCL
jgi:signal peptidase I